jgi:hypothetical protein
MRVEKASELKFKKQDPFDSVNKMVIQILGDRMKRQKE